MKSEEIGIKYLWEEVKDQENKINKTTTDSLAAGCIRLQTHSPVLRENGGVRLQSI